MERRSSERHLSSMQSTRQAGINAQNLVDSAREAAAKAEWDSHNATLGAKDQVIARYGDDSSA